MGLTPNDENGLDKRSVVDVFHIRSVSTERFKRKIGVVTAEQLDDIAAAIAIGVDMLL
ncbi:MAG: type II toxin-antitoxin system PemK/MazF family toxin [Firmicutes bacterium]|nr:type II toxin-antitoxin system PemK/MazF family toxin [Bacillota bacterium]